MNPTDLILDGVQREVELSGRSHSDCVYLNDFSFKIERSKYHLPSDADHLAAVVDVEWFFLSANEGKVVPHPQPDSSWWLEIFGRDALPYGYSWNINALLGNIHSPDNWRRAILYNPAVHREPPCVLCYQFHPDTDDLHVTATLRSSDVYKCLPQDVTMTNLILSRIAERSGLKPGNLTFNIGNAHSYYEDMEFVEEFTIDWGD